MLNRIARLRPGRTIVGAALIAVTAVALIVATGVAETSGTSDITKLECDSGFVAVGNPFASRAYATPERAAAAYASGLRPNGEPIPEDHELIRISEAEAAGAISFAVRVDGRTVSILGVEGGAGGWAVGGDETCS